MVVLHRVTVILLVSVMVAHPSGVDLHQLLTDSNSGRSAIEVMLLTVLAVLLLETENVAATVVRVLLSFTNSIKEQ
jgi:hypothetical protein